MTWRYLKNPVIWMICLFIILITARNFSWFLAFCGLAAGSFTIWWHYHWAKFQDMQAHIEERTDDD